MTTYTSGIQLYYGAGDKYYGIYQNYKKYNASFREAFDANQIRLWGLHKAPSNDLVNVLNEKYGKDKKNLNQKNEYSTSVDKKGRIASTLHYAPADHEFDVSIYKKPKLQKKKPKLQTK